MNHVWGLFSHPDREMQVIKGENETVSHHYTHHVLFMAAVPVICAFIGTTQLGWNFGEESVVQLNWFTAFYLTVIFYALMLAGVAVMGRVFGGWQGVTRSVLPWHAVWCLPVMSQRRYF